LAAKTNRDRGAGLRNPYEVQGFVINDTEVNGYRLRSDRGYWKPISALYGYKIQ